MAPSNFFPQFKGQIGFCLWSASKTFIKVVKKLTKPTLDEDFYQTEFVFGATTITVIIE